MSKKSLVLSTAIASSVLLGGGVASADTTSTTDDTSSSQASTQPVSGQTFTLMARSADTATSGTDDGTSIDNSGTDTGSGGNTDDGTDVGGGGNTDGGSTGGTGTDGGSTGGNTDNGGGTNTDGGSTGGNTDNGGGTDTDGGSTGGNTDNGGGTNTDGGSTGGNTDNGGGSTGGNTNTNNGGGTTTNPDVNDKGETVHVDPVPVKQPSQGQAPSVPDVVASLPSVASAVQKYNDVLSANDNNADKPAVVEAKKAVDEAVKKALPETHAKQTNSSVGFLAVLAIALVSLGGLFGVKRFKLSRKIR